MYADDTTLTIETEDLRNILPVNVKQEMGFL